VSIVLHAPAHFVPSSRRHFGTQHTKLRLKLISITMNVVCQSRKQTV